MERLRNPSALKSSANKPVPHRLSRDKSPWQQLRSQALRVFPHSISRVKRETDRNKPGLMPAGRPSRLCWLRVSNGRKILVRCAFTFDGRADTVSWQVEMPVYPHLSRSTTIRRAAGLFEYLEDFVTKPINTQANTLRYCFNHSFR